MPQPRPTPTPPQTMPTSDALADAMAGLDAGLASWAAVIAGSAGPAGPAGPSNAPESIERHLLSLKRSTIDFFDHWHRGYHELSQYDATTRREQIDAIPIPPRLGEWGGLQWPLPRSMRHIRPIGVAGAPLSSSSTNRGSEGVVVAARSERSRGRSAVVNLPRGLCEMIRRTLRRRRRRRRNGDDEDENDDEGQDGERRGRRRRDPFPNDMNLSQRRLTGRLSTALAEGFRPAGWQFKRVLGQGGFGAVFLFEMVGEEGQKVPLVVKASNNSGPQGVESLQFEAENIVRMAGAQHFIQRVITSDLPLPRRESNTTFAHRFPRMNSVLSRLSFRKQADSRRRRRRRPRDEEEGHERPRAPTPYAAAGDFARHNNSNNNNNNSAWDTATAFLHQIAEGGPSSTARNQRQRQGQQGDHDPDDQAGPYTPAKIAAIRAARKTLDHRPDIILLENMPNGSVHDLIARLVARNETLSNRMLWLIFECLFKSCVAMAYQGRWREADKDPWEDTMRTRDERVPVNGEEPDWPMVHFDLDPQNVLVGELGQPGETHSNVPIFKVADPGLSRVVEDHTQMSEDALWAFRSLGKWPYYAPEQFTRAWDYQASISAARLHSEPVAGNYHWWTNLFHVGWIMWSLLTHCFPPVPAQASPYCYNAEGPSESAAGPSSSTFSGAAAASSSSHKGKEREEKVTYSGWTHGGLLTRNEQMDRYDFSLRLCIQRCLDDNPTSRPEMAYLQSVMDYFVRRGRDGQDGTSDEELRAEVQRLFGGP